MVQKCQILLDNQRLKLFGKLLLKNKKNDILIILSSFVGIGSKGNLAKILTEKCSCFVIYKWISHNIFTYYDIAQDLGV